MFCYRIYCCVHFSGKHVLAIKSLATNKSAACRLLNYPESKQQDDVNDEFITSATQGWIFFLSDANHSIL